MKRVGNIFDAVVEPANLELAFWKASRGKRTREDQRQYQANLDEELQRLREGLLDGSYPVGQYRRFVVCEPKERTICAAAFRERVLHHALMNVLEPHIERWLIFDSYACRVGKGQLRAVRRAQQFAKRYRWFMKCDIKKFFDSVPLEGLEEMLNRKLKDRRMVVWLLKIVATYETTPGRGVPIGNLTSQHLANLYLDQIDRFASGHVGRVTLPGTGGPRGARTLPVNLPCTDDVAGRAARPAPPCFGYVRYMDDKEEGRRREASGSNRVIRGGSWNNNAQNCRSANRNNNNPSNYNNNLGFRLSSTLPPRPGSAGSHSARPALREGEDENARSAAAGSAARRERRGRASLGGGQSERSDLMRNAV